jgi:hypothetical protein
MPSPTNSPTASNKSRLSTDTWAVILSLSLALLIRIGLLKSVPW